LKVLFAICGWGLGHATRDLVLIRALLRAKHQVTILTTGRALRLLRYELGNACSFIDLQDIPAPLSRWATVFHIKMVLSLPLMFRIFWKEYRTIGQLQRLHRFDRIISDTRYGASLREVPSFYLVHSLRQILPGRPAPLEAIVERVQKRLMARARKLIIPDQKNGGLAGDLCHNLVCSWKDRVEYIGILSSVERRDVEQDIDYFITISGPEPQRTIFERIVLEQVYDLQGRIVIALGKPEALPNGWANGRVTVNSFMGRKEQEEMMNRARLVVSRSGYTTLMELAELGKKALFVPTLGQCEQEYLGDYHEKMGTMHCVSQRRLDLARDVVVAQNYRGIPIAHRTEESVNRFLDVVENG
jgi:uncharacterized protein (TIGR00661 family)